MRDRLYLAPRLHFTRGRQVPDAARIAIDNVIVGLGGHLDPATGKPTQSGVVRAREVSDLESATSALERVIRHDQRRDRASADDVAALALLRRVRNAARRAVRASQ